MKIQFYNSLTNRTEEFLPIEPGKVKMYSCGPTVYDFAHIGNFRSFLFGDLLRRFLELTGLEVHHVMNITDVGHMTDESGEDRMKVAIDQMKADKKSGRVPDGAIENPGDPYQIADYFTKAFLDDARQLGYKIAFEYPQCVPKATESIEGMQKMIATLLEREHAYIASDGVVYFSVDSFPDYGKLSNNTLEALMSGAGGRVSDDDQALKRHPADFMLWKPDEKHIMKWDSPWGTGYPGWHIECSVMASDLLGSDVIDIHTGGEDLIFPHHECEIAQSRGASGADSFANFWIHARFLMVEGEKMSKSKGNFYTFRDVHEGRFKKNESGEMWGRTVDAAVIRFELIKAHYRSNLNFTAKGLVDSANTVRRLTEFRAAQADKAGGEAAEVDLSHPVLNDFANALADDLNISEALAVVNGFISSNPGDAHEALGVLQKINSVLSVAPINEGLAESVPDDSAGDDAYRQAEQWCKELDAARADKDYAKADEIRAKLQEAGFEVRTTKEGTTIQKQLV